MPILNPAPSWIAPRSQYIILWHGCTTIDKNAIESNPAFIDPTKGRPDTDFGRGFYTTTIEQQARHWAWVRFYDPNFKQSTGLQPVVLRFKVERHKLGALKSISFGSGDYDNLDFWSMVQHCRQSTPLSAPPPRTMNDQSGPIEYMPKQNLWWYDIACGPVAAFWEQRSAMKDADQISFHTKDAAELLNDLIRSKDPDQYRWDPVT